MTLRGSSALQHEGEFAIDPGHPALAGHFPGSPIVPGVLVLEHVVSCLEAWRGKSLTVRGIPHVKFPGSLLPGERARISLDLLEHTLRFVVAREGRTIAQGVLELGETHR